VQNVQIVGAFSFANCSPVMARISSTVFMFFSLDGSGGRERLAIPLGFFLLDRLVSHQANCGRSQGQIAEPHPTQPKGKGMGGWHVGVEEAVSAEDRGTDQKNLDEGAHVHLRVRLGWMGRDRMT
jgi:hypothetical protein